MKRKTLIFFLMLAIGTPWAAKAQTTLNISSQEDWDTFASNPGNYTTVNLNTNNVTVTSGNMVGTENNPFTGTFNGQGNTIYISVTNASRFASPFKCVDGATIRNVHVEGAITGGSSDGKLLGGLVGVSFGDTHIIGCSSSVTVTGHSAFWTDAALGGLVAGQKTGTLTIEGCVFTGSLISKNGNNTGRQCGGIMAYQWPNTGSNCIITNTVFAPTTLTLNTSNSGLSNQDHRNSTFTRAGTVTPNTSATVTNCYYATALGVTTQGKQAYTITGDSDITVTMNGSATNYGVSQVTAFSDNPGLLYDGTIIAGNGDQVSLNLSGSNNGYEVLSGSLSGNGNPYTLTMASSNVLIYDPTNIIHAIYNAADWNTFCTMVESGYNYSGETVTLEANISEANAVTTMCGSDSHRFSGTFDGQGNTLYVNIENNNMQGAAPFAYIENATIKDLVVSGSVKQTASQPHASGLVGRVGGSNSIENCLVHTNVTNSAGSGNRHIGGLIGHAGSTTLTIIGTVYDGTLTSASYKGGLVGWSGACTLTLQNSFFKGQHSGDGNFHPIGCNDKNYASGTVTNCYYTVSNSNLSDDNDYAIVKTTTGKGKFAYTISGDTGVTVNFNGASTTYTVSGIASYGTGIKYNNVLYAGNSDQVSLNLSGSSTGYEVNTGSLSGSGNPYTLTMGNGNTTISKSTTGDILAIYTASDWNDFCSAVNNGTTNYSGKTVTLEADILAPTAVSTMCGTSDHPFSGTFDGQGHTINVSIGSSNSRISSQGAAPFQYISGATIKDLTVTGNVYASEAHASGLVGFTNAGSNTIQNCLVSTQVNSTSSHAGGMIGHGKSAITTLNGCVFNGSITAAGGQTAFTGGLIGWCDRTPNLTLNYCLFNGTYGSSVQNFHPIGFKDPGGTYTLNITHCYYTKDIYSGNGTNSGWPDVDASHIMSNDSQYCLPYKKTNKGKFAYTISGTGGVTVAFGGTPTSYGTGTVAGIVTGYNPGLQYDNTLYAGNEDNVTLSLSGSPTGLYQANHGTLTASGANYTLAMEAYNTEISVLFTKTIAGVGAEHWTENGGYYLIASPLAADVNPAKVGMITDDDAAGYTYNLYSFDQAADKEWRSYAANSFDLEPGKGYLYASKNGTTLTFAGTPYSGDGKVTLSKTDGVRFSGWNLVGNPFAQNAYIAGRQFYIINPDGRAEIIPATNIRDYVEPMEGIFVIANSDGEEMTFSTELVSGNQAQALTVSLIKTDTRDAALIDRAIVSFSEESQLPKFQLNPSHTKLYIPQGDKDFAVVHTQAEGELPLNLKVEENGRYTLSVDLEKVSFDYLHLIDNMTGADVDLLAGASTGSATYTFNARTTDYESRFKLVFAATGIEENPSTGSGTFAYNNGSEWVIANEGNATLQVVDMTGRILSSEVINGSCTKAINAAQGVYMLRLVNGENVKVQKIVVR